MFVEATAEAFERPWESGEATSTSGCRAISTNERTMTDRDVSPELIAAAERTSG